ncbi:MAG: hypothetical protein GKR98_16220 [Boseongicola sp.]|nr:MAG: hypothetical protein GKR98_16220 [Boseongicola sp.]
MRDSAPSDGLRFLFTGLYALWVLLFCYAFFAFLNTPSEGDGFTAGMNRPLTYLGWQGAAGMLAFAVFGVGRHWPKGSPARRLSLLPLVIALLHVIGIVGVIFWARA